MSYTAFQAHAYLHHLGLYSSKPNELANFYKTVLKMKKVKSGTGWILKGDNRKISISQGPKADLAFAAFACQDIESLKLLKKTVLSKGVKVVEDNLSLFEKQNFAKANLNILKKQNFQKHFANFEKQNISKKI